MEKYYHFAGVDLTIDIPGGWMYEEDLQLAPFRASRGKDAHVFSFQPVDSLGAPEGKLEVRLPGVRVYRKGSRFLRYIGSVETGWENAYIRAEYGEKNHSIQVKTPPLTYIGVKTVLNALMAEHLVAQNRGFLFHCAYIDAGGKAILFTAPSGTGKSTQADLWHEYRGAEIINGDRAAVRLADGVILAEGIPFSGSSQYCKNRSLPIAAIVYLGQAQETTVRKLRGYEAFAKLWEGVSVNTWDREDLDRVSYVVQKTVEQIPMFHMPCTPDESAVIALEEALRKQEIL